MIPHDYNRPTITPTALVEQQARLRHTPEPVLPALPNATYTRSRIESCIGRFKNLSNLRCKELADQLPAEARSHSTPEVIEQFHRRDRKLNDLPFFFAAFETEIAQVDAIGTLPQTDQDAYAVRMVGKRFIDTNTGQSIFNDPAIGRGNPHVQVQNRLVREIRAEAATASFDRYGSNYIKQLHDEVVTKLNLPADLAQPVTVHLVRPARAPYADDCTINFLSLVTQSEVSAALNSLEVNQAKSEGRAPRICFSDAKACIVLSRTARSNAGPIGRLVQQGYFDTSEIRPGDKVIIADDHTQAGGTILAMAAALDQAGADVLAATTPTTHPFCAKLVITEEQT